MGTMQRRQRRRARRLMGAGVGVVQGRRRCIRGWVVRAWARRGGPTQEVAWGDEECAAAPLVTGGREQRLDRNRGLVGVGGRVEDGDALGQKSTA